MKIFILTTGWPSEQQPQWGVVQRDQAVALQERGHQVVSLYLDIRSDLFSKKFGITKEVKDGVAVWCFYAGNHWAEMVKSVSPHLQYKIVEDLFFHLYHVVVEKEGKPDIVYGHYLRYCKRALEIKNKYGIPAVGIEHWSEMGKENVKKELLQQAIGTYPYLDKLLVVSEALRKNIFEKTGVDATVVNDTYGKEFFYEEHVKKDETVRFVLTGNLRPIKRFDLVIQALGESAPLSKKAQFTIIGDGEEKENLQEMIERYHLSDTVFLAGRRTRDYIVEALHEADAYILSSHLETFGVAPVEALACGVPVIATDCGGSRSYMNDFNGLMIPVDDIKAMAEAISYMVGHYSEYDRKQIAEDCRQRFSIEAIAKQLDSVFEDVIAKSKRRIG